MSKSTNTSQRLISCSFCTEGFSSSEIGEHLMICGNKTDQCPTCKKYIRRAIFAYHYENNCANPDEFDSNDNRASNKPAATMKIQPTSSSQSSSQPGAYNHDNTSTFHVSVSVDPRTSSQQRENTDRITTSVCPHCFCDCEILDMEKHRENCLQNPKNIYKRQESKSNGPSSASLSQVQSTSNSDETVPIPCELCGEPIEWRHFNDHKRACEDADRERRESRLRASNQSSDNLIARCRYCYEERSIAGLPFHENMCVKERGIESRTYRSAYNLPPLRTASGSSN